MGSFTAFLKRMFMPTRAEALYNAYEQLTRVDRTLEQKYDAATDYEVRRDTLDAQWLILDAKKTIFRELYGVEP